MALQEPTGQQTPELTLLYVVKAHDKQVKEELAATVELYFPLAQEKQDGCLKYGL